MTRALTVLIATGTLPACGEVKPGEEKATIVAYDASRTSCGGR